MVVSDTLMLEARGKAKTLIGKRANSPSVLQYQFRLTSCSIGRFKLQLDVEK